MNARALLLSVLIVSILAYFAAAAEPTPLKFGEPLKDGGSVGSTFTYNFTLQSSEGDPKMLLFFLTPYEGDPDFTVTNPKGTINSTDYGRDFIILNVGDSHFAYGYYEVKVECVSDRYCSFSLVVAREEQDIITLEDGIPQLGNVFTDSYVFFRYKLSGRQPFTISVTPLTGDPDLYISTTNQRPTKSSAHTWQEVTYEFGFLEIKVDDPNYKQDAYYYIGVHGYEESEFSMLVSTRAALKRCADGIPHVEDVKAQEYENYLFELHENTHSIRLSLDVINSGDADILADVKPDFDKTNAKWKAVVHGDDTLVIDASDVTFTKLYIKIYGYTGDVIYKFTAESFFSSTHLQEGDQHADAASTTTYNFFMFYHPDPESGLVVVVTPLLGSGAAKAYLGIGSNTRPNADKNIQVSQHRGLGEMLYVPPSEVKVGWYYVGVVGTSEGRTTHYTITIQTNHTIPILSETPAIPLNFVPKGVYRKFIAYFNDAGKDITIAVQAYSRGDPDLYVSTTDWPTKETHMWKSINTGSETVVISHNDANYTSYGTYYISVYGYTDTYFGINYHVTDGTQQLLEGIRYTDYVVKGSYVFYSFYLSIKGRITASLRLLSLGGDADMFFSSTPHPTWEHHEQRAISFGDDVLETPELAPGMYHFSVYGVHNASYDITLTTERTPLDVGEQIFDEVLVNENKYYRVFINNQTSSFSSHVTVVDGSVKLFASPGHYLPTWENATYKADSYGAILAKDKDAHFQHGEWVLGIFGNRNNSFYWVGTHSNTRAANLEAGKPRTAFIGEGDSGKFYYRLSSHPLFLTPRMNVQFRVLKGSPTILAGIDFEPTPQRNNGTYHGDEDIVMVFDELQIRYASMLNFVVLAENDESSLVTVVADLGTEPILLLQGEQLQGHVVPARPTYYKLFSYSQASELLIDIDNCQDSFTLPTVYVSWTGYPNATSHDATTSTFSNGNYSITIKDDIKDKGTHNTAIIGLFELTNSSDFTIYGSVRGDIRPTVPGSLFKLKDVSAQGENHTFTFTVAAASSSSYPLTYEIYLLEVKPEDPIYKYNFHTPCGIATRMPLPSIIVRQDKSADIDSTLVLDVRKSFLVNVIVKDVNGLTQAYTPAFIKHGHIEPVPKNPDLAPSGGLSFGWVLIILLIVGLTLYLGGGAIFNYTQGKRGGELLPNREFWSDLPSLVADGVRFIFSGCGTRSSTKFQRVGEEDDGLSAPQHSSQIHTAGFQISPPPTTATSPTNNTGGGYGTI